MTRVEVLRKALAETRQRPRCSRSRGRASRLMRPTPLWLKAADCLVKLPASGVPLMTQTLVG